MTGRTVEFEFAGPGSLVRGHGARGLIEEVAGRSPVYISRLKGYSCQERTARDVCSLAEARGYNVVVTGPRSRKAALFAMLSAAPPPRCRDLSDTEGGLW